MKQLGTQVKKVDEQYDIINMALAKGEAENYGSAPLGFYPKQVIRGKNVCIFSI